MRMYVDDNNQIMNGPLPYNPGAVIIYQSNGKEDRGIKPQTIIARSTLGTVDLKKGEMINNNPDFSLESIDLLIQNLSSSDRRDTLRDSVSYHLLYFKTAGDALEFMQKQEGETDVGLADHFMQDDLDYWVQFHR